MDMHEMRKMRAEQTEERMLKKIDRVLDEADDSGHLGHEDICTIKDAWKAIWYARQCCKEQ